MPKDALMLAQRTAVFMGIGERRMKRLDENLSILRYCPRGFARRVAGAVSGSSGQG
jgi:hypothetical protein